MYGEKVLVHLAPPADRVPMLMSDLFAWLKQSNYHRWAVCKDAIEKGKALGLPVYKFLKEPLIRRFGEAWYEELCEVAALF